ncbi:ABC transporter ATP-binding protein [Streptococcus pneumoniae]|nr:ABC transporter ATP-binding protein [Streptococcus pneumoniae]
MAHENVIEMRDITKVFGGFVANDKINLHLRKGEIHALLGENGAGKSTLMNMLAGLLEPTSGEIAVNGQVVNLDSPSKAASLGIGMVHQHFMLVEAFTVAENIILGSELTKNGVLDIAGASKEIKALSERYGLAVDPSAKVADISVGAQQRVEILKTLYRGADILIFDEPTAVLTPSEIDELMAIMKNLVKEGKSIILITHKLDEIRAVSDRVTVIRRGKSIETVEIAGATNADLAEMMVGRSVSFKTEKQASKPKEVVLSIKDLVVNENRGVPAVKNLSLDVRAGEIVGIAGIDGNGQSELIQAITGLRKVESGSIELKGDSIVGLHPRQITELSVGHVPEDRHRDGLILEMMISENIALQTYYKEPHSKNGILNYSNITSYAKKLMEEFDVRAASELVPAAALSGGNQQKAIIAREIDRDPDLLIVSQPTRGLDVGAIEYIHKRLIEERDNGKAVLVVSFELDEILNVSDRIAVIHDGKIQGIVSPETTNKQELGVLMAGGNLGKEKSDVKKITTNFGSLDFCISRNFTRSHCHVDLRL